MDAGAFYRQPSHSVSPDFSNPFVNPPQQYRSSHHIPDHSGYLPHAPVASDVGMSQKLDCVLALIEEQRKETASIKTELASLRAEVDGYRSAASSISSSPVTPPATKLPLELSVSCVEMGCS